MAHENKHGGYAAQAKRRGEEYLLCNECGRHHPRYRGRLQMASVPEDDRPGCLHLINMLLVGILIWVILLWAASVWISVW